jgi:hypothetical protein
MRKLDHYKSNLSKKNDTRRTTHDAQHTTHGRERLRNEEEGGRSKLKVKNQAMLIPVFSDDKNGGCRSLFESPGLFII